MIKSLSLATVILVSMFLEVIMWIRSHSKVMKSVNKEAIWSRWSDVNSWHEWIPNVEYCRLEKPFQTGSQFTLKPKGAPAVIVELIDVKKDQGFTGRTRFFGATMDDVYEMQQDSQGIRLTVTLKVTGPLGFLWRMLVAEKMLANLPALMNNLAGVISVPVPEKAQPEFKLDTPAPKNPKLPLLTPASKKAQTQPGTSTPKKSRVQFIAAEQKKGALPPKPSMTVDEEPKLTISPAAPEKAKPQVEPGNPLPKKDKFQSEPRPSKLKKLTPRATTPAPQKPKLQSKAKAKSKSKPKH